jgi:asparagine synthetase B (glutamine-hydrolysing)
LSGLGSDELIGGYGRHRTVYGTGGWKAVIDEVKYLLHFQPFMEF